eukprot:TRINITY_DN8586_c0_g1_i1.p3 TRINITY_DN8586_c0_g1~~TRINITY_DN8586_c0_g1_i1.p3  ORF type:complete len:103 (+),score=13.06 TRINITY_DN8586_c0_g1_i1:71-379(+)
MSAGSDEIGDEVMSFNSNAHLVKSQHSSDQLDCVAPPSEMNKWKAIWSLFRSGVSNLRGTHDVPIVAAKEFFQLTGSLIDGSPLSFEAFRGKVTLVVNIASK